MSLLLTDRSSTHSRALSQSSVSIPQRHSTVTIAFDFTGGSVGNYFFAGARTFFGSLPAAIFLFSKVAGIPSGSHDYPHCYHIGGETGARSRA